MIATTFDTLMYAKKLREAGVPEKQAEVQAEALKEVIEDNLATKTDLVSMREKIEVQIKELETKLETKIKELEYKLIIKMGIMLVAVVSLLTAIIKL